LFLFSVVTLFLHATANIRISTGNSFFMSSKIDD
jgi:hypothetical protein